MGLVVLLAVLVMVVLLVLAVGVLRSSRRPRPALPANCGDCVFMIPRAKVYKRETIEDDDGLIHYLCQQRWIEITPYSPRCELGRSKTRTVAGPA